MRQLVVAVPAEFEAAVVEALEGECQLKNVTRISDGFTSRLTCFVAAQECGLVLHELDKVGCGTAYGKVALLPVHLLKPLPNLRDRHLTTLVNQITWHMRGRMATEEIYTNVASGTEMSFDYLAFVVVAGLIAAVGLATNSSVMIVASMLVSPLMGPILAFSFGTSVQDTYLIKKGLIAEAAGVLLTFLVGFIVGLVVCGWVDVASNYDWPTAEMLSRGQDSGLIVGVFFAVPSGAGVALSTTQGGTNALVGVAIAASLLPPVVNTGLCLAFAAAGANRAGRDRHEFFRISWMSFCLFLINVGCIYFVCILFFRIKDIKKVRKQLSTYRDLPRLSKAKAGQASSNLVGSSRNGNRGSTDGKAVGGAGGSSKGTTHNAPAAGRTQAYASAAAATGAVTIQVTGDMEADASGPKRVHSPPPAALPTEGNGSQRARGLLASPTRARNPSDSSSRGSSKLKAASTKLAAAFGPLLRMETSGSRAGSPPRSRRGSGAAAGQSGSGRTEPGAGTPTGTVRRRSRFSSFSLRGWQKVRKVVLEEKRLKAALESGQLESGMGPEMELPEGTEGTQVETVAQAEAQKGTEVDASTEMEVAVGDDKV